MRSHLPKFLYRFEDLQEGVPAILAHMLSATNFSRDFNVSSQDLLRGFELPQLQPLNSSSHASMQYFAAAFDKYSRQQLEAVLQRQDLQPLMKHFGYDLLYRAWLDAQASFDLVQRQMAGAPDAAQRLTAERENIKARLVSTLHQIFKHTRAQLYPFYDAEAQTFNVRLR